VASQCTSEATEVQRRSTHTVFQLTSVDPADQSTINTSDCEFIEM